MKKIIILILIITIFLLSGCVCPPNDWEGPWPPWCAPGESWNKPGTEEINFPSHDDNTNNIIDETNITDNTSKPELIDAMVEIITPRSDETVTITIDGTEYETERVNEIYVKTEIKNVEVGAEYTLSFDGKTKSGTITRERNFDYLKEPGKGREFFKGIMVWACHYCDISYSRGNFLEQAKKEYKEVKELGGTWVNIIPVWFFDDIYSAELRPIYREEYGFDGKSGWQHATITDEELKTLIGYAHDEGLKVFLSPHVASVEWGPDVKGKNDWAPKDVDAWLESFKVFTEHYSSIAEETDVEMYSIGNEIETISVPANENNPGVTTEHWYEIIEVARENYSGPLTFSEACTSIDYCNPEMMDMWDKLDYIGYEWYLPINVANDATLEEITAGAEEIFEKLIKPLSEKYNKPVVFTEIGFEAKDHVWNGTYVGGSHGGEYNKLAPAMAYDAVLEALKDKEYVKGMMVWSWQLGEEEHMDYWVYTYNGNEIKRSLTLGTLGKWFNYYK